MGDPLEEIHRWLTREGLVKHHDIIVDVVRVEQPPGVLVKIRVLFRDGSFLDIYWDSRGRYSLHYERRHIDGHVYRHDNAPHYRHRHVKTWPRHYHQGSEDNVVESNLPQDPVKAVDTFLNEIRRIIREAEQRAERRQHTTRHDTEDTLEA